MNLRDRIKALLNQAEAEAQEVKFATADLADGGGTITNNSEEAMAPGQEVFLIVEGEEGDELIPLADGIYMLADGTHVSVAAGIIEEIQPAEEAAEAHHRRGAAPSMADATIANTPAETSVTGGNGDDPVDVLWRNVQHLLCQAEKDWQTIKMH